MGFNFGNPDPACSCGCATAAAGAYCVTVGGCLTPVVGATVSLSRTGVTTITGTTDATGKVCLSFPSTGTYTLTITPPTIACESYDTLTQSVTLGAGTTNATKALNPSSGWHCCGDGSHESQIPDGTSLFMKVACSASPILRIPGSNTYCSWGTNGSGDFQISYIGNCTWKLVFNVDCGPCSSIPCPVTSYASGPAALPVSLTFLDPGDPNGQPTRVGCGEPDGFGNAGINCGGAHSIWPILVTS